MSQLNRFAGASSHVVDFNISHKLVTQKDFKQGIINLYLNFFFLNVILIL